MYAVIATGGKQYRVQEGAVVRIEKLDADQGASVEFNQVLLVGAGSSVTIGAPYVECGQGGRHGGESWQGRQGAHCQIPPPQALQAREDPSAALYRCEDHVDRRLRRSQEILTWHTKKQAAVLVTAAIRIPSV